MNYCPPCALTWDLNPREEVPFIFLFQTQFFFLIDSWSLLSQFSHESSLYNVNLTWSIFTLLITKPMRTEDAHYSAPALWCRSLVIAINLYRHLVKVFGLLSSRAILFYCILGWGKECTLYTNHENCRFILFLLFHLSVPMSARVNHPVMWYKACFSIFLLHCLQVVVIHGIWYKACFSMHLLRCLHCTDEAHIGRNIAPCLRFFNPVNSEYFYACYFRPIFRTWRLPYGKQVNFSFSKIWWTLKVSLLTIGNVPVVTSFLYCLLVSGP